MSGLVVVGLGNPGTRYRDTRHNVGSMVVEELIRRDRSGPTRRGSTSTVTPVRLAGTVAFVVQPRTYMNESGVAVADALDRLGMVASELLLVYDDADLPLGRIRIRMEGGAAGHRGVRSILESLGTTAIRRIRLGIGKSEGSLADRVLSRFSAEEAPVVESMVETAANAVEEIARDGILIAMNKFNRRADSPG
ncbi:MAG: aminoacyl-tRNA hydrolase [Acidobacteriota bacterium]